MNHKITLACLGVAMCGTAIQAQTTTSPSAWVYVVSQAGANNGPDEIHAYQANSDGALSTIAGSPFQDNVNQIAVNGKYLFGGLGGGTNIDAYHMGSNGALSLWESTQAFAPNCGEIGPMFMDHTGATLYMWNYDGDANCSAATWDAYTVDKSNGKLTLIGTAGDSPYIPPTLTFSGNNEFAYGSIYEFKRNSNGTLTQLDFYPAPPPAPSNNANEFYYPLVYAAADPTNHVIIPVTLVDNGNDATPQLAVYTADSSGNLTTTSTYSNMPYVQVGYMNAISMSPSGKLLAVAGNGGLQIFHVNGGNPVTKYTGLLTTDAATQVYWDNDNHLYAIFKTAGKLRVYTVTPASYTEPKGSPHVVANPIALMVQILPR
jgi:6-phosphogluconolactonase (cycloisomerase 2 family)